MKRDGRSKKATNRRCNTGDNDAHTRDLTMYVHLLSRRCDMKTIIKVMQAALLMMIATQLINIAKLAWNIYVLLDK